jgi:hypothetical protein
LVVVGAVGAAEIVERAKTLTVSGFSRNFINHFSPTNAGRKCGTRKNVSYTFSRRFTHVDKAKKLTCAKE